MKTLDFHFTMEETPLVEGTLVSDQTKISDKEMLHELELKGFGEQENNGYFLKPFESLYLLYTDRLVLKKIRRKIDFNEMMEIAQTHDSNILTKFLIYRDLRNRGYVVKDGFGFGSDFRVYERGHFGEKGAKFLIFGLNEGQKEKMGNLQNTVEQITQMGKEPVIAVIERRGEIIYYKINKMNFYENKSKIEF